MPPEVEPVVAIEVADDAPNAAPKVEPIATPPDAPVDADAGAGTPNFEDLMQTEEAQAHIAKAVEKAQDSARNKLLAEQRRNFANPELVEQTMLGIMTDAGVDPASITRSMRDRAGTLYSTAAQAVRELFLNEIPTSFLGQYDFEPATLVEYNQKFNGGDPDGAFKLLIDNAVSQTLSASEAGFEKRVKDEVDARVNSENGASGSNGQVRPPSTVRGTPAGQAVFSLTTTEIARMPSSTWVGLPADVKAALTANVASADAERGREDYDGNRLVELEAATSKS